MISNLESNAFTTTAQSTVCCMLFIVMHSWVILIKKNTDDDNLIILKPLPDNQDCYRDYINASYVDVCIVLIGIFLPIVYR